MRDNLEKDRTYSKAYYWRMVTQRRCVECSGRLPESWDKRRCPECVRRRAPAPEVLQARQEAREAAKRERERFKASREHTVVPTPIDMTGRCPKCWLLLPCGGHKSIDDYAQDRRAVD